MSELKASEISAIFHYVPLHTSSMGLGLGYKQGELPKTENLSRRLLRIPMYAQLKDTEINYIIEKIHELIT